MEIVRSWRELRVMMKNMFPQLTDDDFNVNSGNKEHILDNLAKKIQKSRNELDQILVDLQKY